jgi:hypothetical protein
VTLHFLHVGKTGGTALKQAFRRSGMPDTPYGPIKLHRHAFRLHELPPGDHVLFCVRDPIARYVSGFYSRFTKGQPRYYFEWTERERIAFERFATPQQLAKSLASDDEEERALAEAAMTQIRHLRPMQRYVGPPKQVREHLKQIVYIGRQETLSTDWEHIKAILQLPAHVELTSDPKKAHRRDSSLDTSLDEDAIEALRRWYARDLRLVEYCELIRAQHGWGGAQKPNIARRVVQRVRSHLPR